jgi:hypothetical protein
MHVSYIVPGLAALFAVQTAAAPTTLAPRQSTDGNIGLYLNSTQFDINYLQTLKVSYANSSAYIGAIKYLSYAEPLVIGDFNGNNNAVSFLSIHSSPTGFQQMYITPHQSLPVGFSVPHGGAPAGVSTSGFSFGPRGALLHNGLNKFFACQDDALAELNSYQIFWNAAGQPAGFTCQGPIKLGAGDACSRF